MNQCNPPFCCPVCLNLNPVCQSESMTWNGVAALHFKLVLTPTVHFETLTLKLSLDFLFLIERFMNGIRSSNELLSNIHVD